MFCENCGSEIEENSLFCENCGARQEKPTQNPVQEPVTQQPIQQSIQQQTFVHPMQSPQLAPMPKAKKILIAEVIILILVAIGVFQLGTKLTSPQTIAENYFEAETEGDLTKLYSMFDLPASPLLTYDLFELTMQEDGLKNVTNYKVTEDKGDFDVSEDAIVKNFSCEYIASGESAPRTEQISLVKQKEKKWLFFDQWRVSPGNIVNDFQIIAPSAATVKMNGMNLAEIAIHAEEDEYSPGNTTYMLPSVFAGKYDLMTEIPCTEAIEDSIEIEYPSEIRVSGELVLTKEAEQELEEKASEITQAYYSDALDAKGFDEFLADTKVTWSEDELDYLKSNYEDRTYDFNGNERYIYHSALISDADGDISSLYINENGNLEASLSMDYRLSVSREIVTTDWWSGEETRTMDEYQNNSTDAVTFEYADGEWIVMGANIY